MGISSGRRQFIEQYVTKREYTRIGAKTTICLVTLYNGFEMIGQSSCVDPKAFNKELGELYAYEDALEKLDPYFGFLQVDRAHINNE